MTICCAGVTIAVKRSSFLFCPPLKVFGIAVLVGDYKVKPVRVVRSAPSSFLLCFYSSADGHATTSRQAAYNCNVVGDNKAALPPLIVCRMAREGVQVTLCNLRTFAVTLTHSALTLTIQ